MKHLSPQEFIDLGDGALAPDRVAHVEGCAQCRAHGEALSVVMREARAVHAPEPSPLFWDHLSTRVRDAVATDSDGRAEASAAMPWWRAWSVGRLAVVTAMTLVLAGGIGVWVLRGPGPLDENAVVAGDPAVGMSRPVGVGSADAGDEPEWTLLLAMADAVEWADADTDGWAVDRQTVEGAVFEMSADERRELARLLEGELDAAPGDAPSSL